MSQKIFAVQGYVRLHPAPRGHEHDVVPTLIFVIAESNDDAVDKAFMQRETAVKRHKEKIEEFKESDQFAQMTDDTPLPIWLQLLPKAPTLKKKWHATAVTVPGYTISLEKIDQPIPVEM